MGQSKSKPVLQKVGRVLSLHTHCAVPCNFICCLFVKWNLRQAQGMREGQQAGRGSAWIYLLKHTFLPPKTGCRQSLKKPLGQVMVTMYSPVLLFSQGEIIWSTEPSSLLRERIYVAGLHPHWASWVLGLQAGTLMPSPVENAQELSSLKSPVQDSCPTVTTLQGLWFSFVRIKMVPWEWLL